jgi:hypothetical protein
MARRSIHTGMINGLPGFVTREADGELQTTALEIADGKVTAIYVMRNPDKLKPYALSGGGRETTDCRQ